MSPRLLDLYCGAGGAAYGYHLAGFDDITGVDIAPQRRYPYQFVQADALEYVRDHGREYDAIHASPPCQGYSIMVNNLPWFDLDGYPLLIAPTRAALQATGKPWVIENVMGARQGSAVLRKRGLEAHGMSAGYLCGQMFGLLFYRHRLFEASFLWLAPTHPKHRVRIRKGKMGRSRDITFPNPVNTEWRTYHDGTRVAGDTRGPASWPRRRETPAGATVSIPTKSGNFDPNWREHQLATPTTLSDWQNGSDGVGIGHARGWRLAASG